MAASDCVPNFKIPLAFYGASTDGERNGSFCEAARESANLMLALEYIYQFCFIGRAGGLL